MLGQLMSHDAQQVGFRGPDPDCSVSSIFRKRCTRQRGRSPSGGWQRDVADSGALNIRRHREAQARLGLPASYQALAAIGGCVWPLAKIRSGHHCRFWHCAASMRPPPPILSSDNRPCHLTSSFSRDVARVLAMSSSTRCSPHDTNASGAATPLSRQSRPPCSGAMFKASSPRDWT